MSAVTMDPYSPADRDACLAVFDANTPYAFAPHERDEFSAFLDSPGGRYLVLRDPDGSVVACGGADLLASGRFGVITWAMVLPTRQRQGLGSMLTRAGMAYVAAIPHAERIVLETSNVSAPFYERHGFRTTKVTPNHYAPGVHLHNMALELDDDVRRRLRGDPQRDQPRTRDSASGHTEAEAR